MKISEETLQDLINIETGLLAPLKGFMGENDFKSVVENYTLANGEVFTIPVTLDVPRNIYETAICGNELQLESGGIVVGFIRIDSKFEISDADIEKVFGTKDDNHPGVYKEKARFKYRIGGKTRVTEKRLLDDALKPEDTKAVFRNRGWETVVGFQTRNPIHRAHEFIQRLGLEICDGLFINPIVGWKKVGDFSEEAVMAAYHTMIEKFYPKDRVYIAGLCTQMRYAGPREALFHAIIRRNLGCTHFIIGRDHAGVGGYYGAYDAHKLAKDITGKHDLGIELLLTREPYYCTICKQIVTDNTCGHYKSGRVEISGTIVRKYIKDGSMPDEIMLRQEILDSITACDHIFIE